MKIQICKYDSQGAPVDLTQFAPNPRFSFKFLSDELVIEVNFIKNPELKVSQVLAFKGLLNCRYKLPDLMEALHLGDRIFLIYEGGHLRLEAKTNEHYSQIRIPIKSDQSSYKHIDQALEALLI